MTALTQMGDECKKVISSIATQYSSIFLVNIKTQEFEPIKVHSAVRALAAKHSNSRETLSAYIRGSVAPEYREELNLFNNPAVISARLKETGSVTVEFKSTTDGRGWCKAHWILIKEIDGEPEIVIFAVEDISEFKTKDAEIERQSKYIDGLINGYDILTLCNLKTNTWTHRYYCDEIAKSTLKQIGSSEELTSGFEAAMRENCHPDFKNMMYNYAKLDVIRALLKGKKRHTQRFLCSDLNGGYRWIELGLIKFGREDEEPVEIAITYTNVDADERERRMQQEALEDIRHIVNSTEMGIWRIELVQGKKPTMEADSKMRELLGLKKDEELTPEEMYEAWHSRIYPDALESVNESVMKMISNIGVRDENTYLWVHPQKGQRYVRCGGTAMPVMGGHMLSGYHYDVTEHVLHDMQQKEIVEEALAANEAKTTFLHNMIHEIRTPLNAIVGFSQLLGMPDGTWSPEEKEEHSKQIENAYNMLSMLIEDVLDVADSKHGNYIVNIAETNVNNICRNALKAAEFRKPGAVKMIFTTDVDDDYTIQSDGRRITQVLYNYLNNACKHTKAGSIHLHCSTKETPGKLTFSVSDTGEGVPAEMAENIFDRFTKHNANVLGSGLGLDICRVVAEKLNGKMYLDTNYTNGARFVFVL